MATSSSPDRHTTVFIVTLVFTVLATVFVGLRMLSKGWIVKRFTTDDWFTVAAWIFMLGVTVSIMIGAQDGLGMIDSEIPPVMVDPQESAIYAFTVFYNLAIMTTKTAILILYVRLAAAHAFLRRASIATMVVVNLAGTMLVLLNIFRCRPIRAAFTSVNGSCINLVSIFLSTSPINILTDFAILLLPLPILTRLRMEFRQKVVLVATFIVGGFVTIVDVVRVVYLQNALKAEYAENTNDPSNTVSQENTKNYGYHVSYSLMWSGIEVSVGLICCCILVLKPLVMRVLPAILKDPNKSTLTGTLLSFDVSQPRGSQSQSLPSTREFAGTMDTTVGTRDTDPTEVSGAAEGETRNGSRHQQNGGTGRSDGDETFDLFDMLASDPQHLGAHAAHPPHRKPERQSHSTTSKIKNMFGHRHSTSTDTTQEPTQAFFDFVRMGGKKPLTELTAKESRGPVIFGSILFFLWGFAYGLIGTLNVRVQEIHGFSPSQTFALSCSYWIAYFFAPPVIAYWIITRQGFKATFITGLAFYSVGAMAFWPSAVLASYAGFFIRSRYLSRTK